MFEISVVLDVLLSSLINFLNVLCEVLRYFFLTSLIDVLVDDDEVCLLGVVRDFPHAFQAVDESGELDAARFRALLAEKGQTFQIASLLS